MKHLGDITKINGAEIEPVDVIFGGSPCQDLSQAGKRAGLAGARSGLFMEQIRIVKEMREAYEKNTGRTDELCKCRFLGWENVIGAFSSNSGRDFASVLEEIIRVAEPEAPDVPVPEKGWPHAGCLYDEMGRWSLAWRVHSAEFWGTPQRRKRIALVADFGGLAAPEVLFERKGLCRDFDEGEPQRERAASDIETGIGDTSSYTLKIRGGCAGGGKGPLIQTEKSATLSTLQDQTLITPTAIGVDGYNAALTGYNSATLGVNCGMSTGRNGVLTYNIGSYNSKAWKDGNPDTRVYEADVTRTLDAVNCGYPACNQGGTAVVYDARGNGDGEIVPTLVGDHERRVTDYTSIVYGESGYGGYSDGVGTLRAAGGNLGGGPENLVTSVADNEAWKLANGKETAGTLMACHSTKLWLGNQEAFSGAYFPIRGYAVRRLTPLEAERLQGFPDNWTLIGDTEKCMVDDFDLDTGEKIGQHEETVMYWTDSKGKRRKTSDSARYKALGNSIAVGYANNQSGFWMWLLKRISAQYERSATLGSLFDGIGGFPLAWEFYNGKGSARWASEIEEFPIAVTKYHFPEE